MTTKGQKARSGATTRFTEIRIARVLLGIAFLIAAYLAWISFSGRHAAGCGPESDCDQMLQSRWAYWLGIPVSFPAMMVYAALFLASFFLKDAAGKIRKRAAFCTLLLSALIVAVGLWFLGVQWLVIRRFCPFCLAAHSAALIGAVLFWTNIPDTKSGKKGLSPLTPKQSRRAFFFALVLCGGLAAGQVWFPKKEFSVSTTQQPGVISSNAQVRTIELHQGRFKLALNEYPLRGNPTAPHILVSLFDYTCHHCRESHHVFEQAFGKYSNDLCILSLPMPLDGSCNRLVKKTPKEHNNACDFARLGLAVWRARPQAFEQFDSWMFSPSSPPDLNEAWQYATQLTAGTNLQEKLNDGWIDKTIKEAIALFEVNSQTMTNTKMPHLMIGKSIVLGPIKSLADFEQLMEQNLGVKPR